ncbi:MAG: GNAT family N-acetyltransferase [Chloroflexi bacterium]|nr:MAG: GNAT family N-acetyltransferase [Chloroflexota bacterium]
MFFIDVHPFASFHRLGVGRRLVETIAEWLTQHSISSLLIKVLTINAPARHFYQALGGRLVLADPHEDEGILLEQVGYRWDNINTLLHSQ